MSHTGAMLLGILAGLLTAFLCLLAWALCRASSEADIEFWGPERDAGMTDEEEERARQRYHRIEWVRVECMDCHRRLKEGPPDPISYGICGPCFERRVEELQHDTWLNSHSTEEADKPLGPEVTAASLIGAPVVRRP